jgi:antitoxin Phd
MSTRKSINRRWQLQEAKARLSELVKQAATGGPQEITVRGEPAAVVLSPADYDRLRRDTRKAPNLSDFLLASPLAGLDLEFERDRSLARDADL